MDRPTPGPSENAPTAGQQSTIPDLRLYVGLVLRRSWAIAIVFGVVFVGAVVYVSSLPSIFEATSKIVILTPPGERYVGSLSSPGATGEGAAPVGGSGVSLGTEARMVGSRLRAEKTAVLIREENADLSPRLTTDEITGSLAAETVEPDEIRIHARSKSPERAMLIANATAAICMEESTRDASGELRNRREYIEKLLKTLEGEMRKAESDVANYLREAGLIEEGLLGESGKEEGKAGASGLSEYASSKAEKRMVDAQLTATRAYIAALQQKQNSLSRTEQVSTLLEDPLLGELRKRLTTLEVDLIQAKTKYTDQNPKIQDIQDEIAEVKRRLQEHTPKPIEVPTTQVNPVYESLQQRLFESEMKIVELEAQQQALDAQISKTRTAIKNLPEKRQRLEGLNRIADGLGTRYAALLDKLQDARIDEAVQQGNVKIADLSGVPKRPVLPQRRKTLLFAILIGLAGGIALAFFLDYLDTAIQTPDDIERHAGIPCLGFVPMTIDDTPGSIITIRKPKSPSSEAYRSLRSALKYASLDAPIRTMCVSGAGASEGKSMTTANLAAVTAESGLRVIAVDTDLRRPSLHRLLEGDNEYGVTNVLAGDMPLERALQPTLVDGLLLLATGPLPPNPSELLDSRRMSELVQELSAQCDLVIFDAPPLLVVTDATIMSSKCDATVLVAETGRVSREAVQKCRDLITTARGKVVGVVLNKVRLTKASSYYYYYYYREYYYYGYYGDSARRRGRGRRRPTAA